MERLNRKKMTKTGEVQRGGKIGGRKRKNLHLRWKLREKRGKGNRRKIDDEETKGKGNLEKEEEKTIPTGNIREERKARN